MNVEEIRKLKANFIFSNTIKEINDIEGDIISLVTTTLKKSIVIVIKEYVDYKYISSYFADRGYTVHVSSGQIAIVWED